MGRRWSEQRPIERRVSVTQPTLKYSWRRGGEKNNEDDERGSHGVKGC